MHKKKKKEMRCQGVETCKRVSQKLKFNGHKFNLQFEMEWYTSKRRCPKEVLKNIIKSETARRREKKYKKYFKKTSEGSSCFLRKMCGSKLRPLTIAITFWLFYIRTHFFSCKKEISTDTTDQNSITLFNGVIRKRGK